MHDVHFIADEDTLACACCSCRKPYVKRGPYGQGTTVLCALLFMPAWIYMVIGHLPTVLARLIELL